MNTSEEKDYVVQELEREHSLWIDGVTSSVKERSRNLRDSANGIIRNCGRMIDRCFSRLCLRRTGSEYFDEFFGLIRVQWLLKSKADRWGRNWKDGV